MADGAGERDEPSGAGASLRRLDEQPASERQPAGDAVAALRGAARSLTQRAPPEPAPRKRSKTGKGDGDRHTPQAIVDDYLELCADPSKDLLGWLAAGERKRGRRQQQPITSKGMDYADNTKQTRMADANGIRGHALQAVQIWVDAHRQGGRSANGLPARSWRASFRRYDELRQVQSGTTALAAPRAGNDTAALSALYAAKIETTKRSESAARRDLRRVARLDGNCRNDRA